MHWLNLLTWSLRTECTKMLDVGMRRSNVLNQLVQFIRFQHLVIPSSEEQRLVEEQRTIALTKKEQRRLKRMAPRYQANSQVLKVAMIGAPNAGKSTLANKLIGWKFAAVSQKVHTTRRKTIGMLTEDNKQVIFLDTPGIIVPKKLKRHNLERSLLTDPHSSVSEADLVAVIVDVSHVWHRSRIDQEVLKVLHLNPDKKSVLVLNKVDLLKDKQELLSIVRTLTEGVVGGIRSSSTTTEHKHLPNLKAMFHRMKMQSSNSLKSSAEEPDNASCNSSESNRVSTVSDSATNACGNNTRSSISEKNKDSASDDFPHQSSSVSNQTNLVSEVSTATAVGTPLDFSDTEAWNMYYKELQTIGRDLKSENGWARFDKVFMVSALSGDGVSDLKEYLLSSTYPSPWLHHPSLVTNQNPVELARLCVWEKLLDNLPDEIPYNLKLQLSCWEISEEDGLLRASFDVICYKKRHLRYVLGTDGSTIRRVAAEAKQELMNAFRRELSLRLVVKGAKGIADPIKMQRHEGF